MSAQSQPALSSPLSKSDRAFYRRLAQGTDYESDPALLFQIHNSYFEGRYIAVPSRSTAGKFYLMSAETHRHVAVLLPDGELLEGRGCYRSDTLRKECNHERASRAKLRSSRSDLQARQAYSSNHFEQCENGWDYSPPEQL
jgi:hypothetical protein